MVTETSRELRIQAKDLLKQAERREYLDKINERMDDAAYHLMAFQSALVRSGFTKEEAYELLKLMMAKEVQV